MACAPGDQPLDVLIIGAGISGIGMAAHLRRKSPGKRFAIIERREQLGGTWDLFRYPGVRSDSDMYTLGYEFEPWRKDRSIAEGDEILRYLNAVSEKYVIEDQIRFSTRAVAANWNSATGLWTVALQGCAGEPATVAARFLFVGAGYYDYDDPHSPDIPGLDQFQGLIIHPQFWPNHTDVKNKNIIVIGSGATAVTLVPAMAGEAGHVTMLQRSPSWYVSIPSQDRLARLLRRLLPERWAYRLIRRINSTIVQQLFERSRNNPGKMSAFLMKMVQENLGDSFDENAFTPHYGPWEQRLCVVPDGDLFDAIRSGDASVVTGEIATVEKDGIALADGRRIPADIIVTATGLRLATLGKMTFSLDGVPLKPPDHFYYRNCMLSNVPNFAALFGYLNAAWTGRVDLVADYLCRLFEQMDAWGADVVTPVLPEDHCLVEGDPIAGFSSGYLRRGRHLIPKTATHWPWQLRQDYRADLRESREAPIDDGWLHFERTRRRACAVADGMHLP